MMVRINTLDELKSLKYNILGCEGIVIKDNTGEIYELEDDGTWSTFNSSYVEAEELELPVRVLWRPEWDTDE